MSDYINEISDRLSAIIAWVLAELSSAECLGLTETFARLSFVEQLILLLAVSQAAVLVLAIVIEFSARKRRRIQNLKPVPHEPPPEAPPEDVLAEEITRET